MWSSEIVFNQPFSQTTVELQGISSHIAKRYELILKGSVEPFVHCIVFRRMNSGPVVRKFKVLACCIKMSMELTAIISLDIFNFAVKQDMQTMEKITS